MRELVFEVTERSHGTFQAQAIGASVNAQARNWEQLGLRALEATKLSLTQEQLPQQIRLHLERNVRIALKSRSEQE